jgi:hypothetical protein
MTELWKICFAELAKKGPVKLIDVDKLMAEKIRDLVYEKPSVHNPVNP